MKDYTKNEQPREIRKERFEFVLTVNGNFIIQRYFRINNFNSRSIYSTEFLDSVRRCASMIDANLKSKTEIYIRHNSPLIFDSEEEMRAWFKNPLNLTDVRYGAWIAIRGKRGHDFVWLGDDKFKDEGVRMEYNEFIDEPSDEEDVVFNFTVIDNGYDYIDNPTGKIIGGISWNGKVYPKFIRNGVDIQNGKGKYDDMDISKLSHEMSLYYWCNSGQQDLVPLILRELCEACSETDKDAYTVSMDYGETVYDNLPDYPGPKPEYPYKKTELSKKGRN